jgi:hypothetical protein
MLLLLPSSGRADNMAASLIANLLSGRRGVVASPPVLFHSITARFKNPSQKPRGSMPEKIFHLHNVIFLRYRVEMRFSAANLSPADPTGIAQGDDGSGEVPDYRVERVQYRVVAEFSVAKHALDLSEVAELLVEFRQQLNL